MKPVLFWDFDGTLVYSDHLWSRAALSALGEEASRHEIGWQEIRPLTWGGYPWDTPEQDYLDFIDPERWWEKMQTHFQGVYRRLGLKESIAHQAASRVRQEVLNPLNYTLYPDAKNTLQLLSQEGWTHILLSNNYPELWEVACALGFASYFEDCIVSARVGYEKPRREIFEAALSAAGHPSRALMIGDNPYADILGAHQAGLPAVLVHRDTQSPAEFTAKELRDIPAWLHLWEER